MAAWCGPMRPAVTAAMAELLSMLRWKVVGTCTTMALCHSMQSASLPCHSARATPSTCYVTDYHELQRHVASSATLAQAAASEHSTAEQLKS